MQAVLGWCFQVPAFKNLTGGVMERIKIKYLQIQLVNFDVWAVSLTGLVYALQKMLP